MLAGDWDTAHELVSREKALGWSSSDNPQGLVVPLFLVLLSGKSLDALPTNLAQLWQQGLQNSIGFGSWSGEDEENAVKRSERAYAVRLSDASLSRDQQARVLSWCLDVAKRRVEAIVSNQHRGSYGKAAVLTAACAEALRLRGESNEADAMLDDMRNRFPRHRAFQAELEAAVEQTGRSLKRKGGKTTR